MKLIYKYPIIFIISLLGLCVPLRAASLYASIADSILNCCSHNEIVRYYENLYQKSSSLNGEEALVANSTLARLCVRLGHKDNLMLFFAKINPDSATSSFTKLEIIKSYSDFVCFQSAGMDMVDNKHLPPFAKDMSKEAAYFKLNGFINILLRHYDTAIKEFNDVIAKKPSNYSDRIIRIEAIIGLAEALIQSGAYEKANNMLEILSLDIMDFKVAPVLHSNYFLLRGRLLMNLGDYTTAEKILSEGLQILDNTNECNSYIYSLLLKELGILYMNSEKYEKALLYFQKYRKSVSEVHGSLSVSVLDATAYVMDVLLALGRNDESEMLEANIGNIDIYLNGNLFSFFAYSHFMNAVGQRWLSEESPDVQKLAAEIFQTSLELYRYMDMGDLKNYRDIYNSLGYALFKSDQKELAQKYFGEQLLIDKKLAHDVFLFQPELQRTSYWAKIEPLMNRLFCLNQIGSITLDENTVTAIELNNIGTGLGKTLYDAALLNKCLMLQASVSLKNLLIDSGNVDLIDFADRLTNIRRKQAATTLTPEEELEARDMEYKIIKAARNIGDFMEFANITWEDIYRRLEDNEVAVEFVMSRNGGIQYYSAEIIRKSMLAPEHIFLFGISDNDNSFDGYEIYDSNILYNKIWKKVLKHTSTGEKIYFAPAGKLYNIAIEHAMTPDGNRLSKIYNIKRLSSTREILKTNDNIKEENIVLFGGLNYDTEIENLQLMAMEASSYTRGVKSSISDDFAQRDAWGYLKGTLDEVNSISKIFEKSMVSRCEVFTGETGTEENFKRLSIAPPNILHIATHGFYIPKKHDNLVIMNSYCIADNSLRRSAMLLSGGNNGWLFPELIPNGVEDGVLTAEEISHMNLSGTELVVMSACQTGLGDISNEGVFGLQRAFKLAGAGTMIMSLSPVHDGATQMLMAEFYTRLSQGRTIREAFSMAQEIVKTAIFEIEGKFLQGSDPRFWAPFVVMD